LKNDIMDKENLLNKIDKRKLPVHIAIIMDGNGRWAKKRHLPRTFGHKKGVERVDEIVETAGDIGLKYLTLYAFSTENWQRSKTEVAVLMKLLHHYLVKELPRMQKNNIRFNTIGDIKKLPDFVYDKLVEVKELTGNNSGLTLILALNYGGRDDIVNAINSIIKNKLNKVTETEVSNYLYTSAIPDPDLLIRTSGEQRISNFLLWQLSYSELYFTPVLWPEFDKTEFYKAILEFQNRERRFGGL